MAEALGVIAAVIQIAEAAAKLKSLWHNVKNAPDDLTDCIHDIQHTAKILNRFKDLLSKTVGFDKHDLKECIQDLDDALIALHAVCSDLQRAKDTKRSFSSFEIVLKKDEIARGRRKLERAQSRLSCAQQNLSISLQLQHAFNFSQHHELLLQVQSVMQMTSQNSLALTDCSQSSTSLPGPGTIDSSEPRRSPNQEIIRRQMSCRAFGVGRTYHIRFPRWLTRKCFEIASYHELYSLNFRFTSFNIVEYPGPAWDAIFFGDLDKLKLLFDTGQAHILDQDVHGDTLFNKALVFQQLDIVKFLISQCPSLPLRSDRLRHKYAFIGWTRLPPKKSLGHHFENLRQLWNILTEYAEVNDGVLRDAEKFLNSVRMSGSWAKWLPEIAKVSQLGLVALSKEARAFYAITAPSFDIFEHIVGYDVSIRDVLQLNVNNIHDHAYLLRRIANSSPDEWKQWSSVLREIFDFDKQQQNLASEWRDSTLSVLLSSVDWDREISTRCLTNPKSPLPERRNKTFRNWIHFLESINIDLVHYGNRENRTIFHAYNHFLQGPSWRLIGIVYGSKAKDWKAYYCPLGWEYEIAGDFWSVIENPELFLVPGSFLNYDKETEEFNLQFYNDWKYAFRQQEEHFLELFKSGKEERTKEWLNRGYTKPTLSRRERRLRKRKEK